MYSRFIPKDVTLEDRTFDDGGDVTFLNTLFCNAFTMPNTDDMWGKFYDEKK